MITVAVAARDSSVRGHYQRITSEVGYGALFAPHEDILIRYVKSRPVDLVIFDLSPPTVSVTTWLEAVARDQDLALTPVLWVGKVASPALASTLDNYRPGTRVPERPDAQALSSLVQKLVGRPTPDTHSSTARQEPSARDWTPEDETIENALSIFAEASGGEPERQPRTSNSSAHKHLPKPAEAEAFELRAKELGNSKPRLDVTDAAGTESITGPIPIPPFAAERGESTVPLVEEITQRVLSRLADHFIRSLDADTVRRTVMDVLAERHRTGARPPR